MKLGSDEMGSGHRWAGSVRLGGDWFGSDTLSKRKMYYSPGPPAKIGFVSRTPCQNQYKLDFLRKTIVNRVKPRKFQRFLENSTLKLIKILL